MSNQGYYGQDQAQNPYQQNPPPAHNFQSNNPWADQSGNPPSQQEQPQDYAAYQPPAGPPPSHQQQQYAPPSGPPPGHALPKRTDTFREADFVPEAERGEQREAMQQFEMSHSGQQSQQDRDVEMLQRDFPKIDGSLVAALYADAGNAGATREMLMELDGK